MHPSVAYVCDVCSVEAPATAVVRITWQERHYRIDLCARHAREVGAAVDSWTKNVHPRSRRSSPPKPVAGGYTPKQVREWARSNRLDVPERGRIPQAVIDEYLRHHGA